MSTNDDWLSFRLHMFRPESSIEAGDARAEVHMQEAAAEVWHAADQMTEPDEEPMTDELRHVLVTSGGHWRGEALAVVEAA